MCLYALAKICQKNINKVMLLKSLKSGDRRYVGISGSIWRSYGGVKYWVLIVDHYSRYCWSYLIPEKAGLKFIMLIFFKLLEVTYNICVEKLCLDNASKNIAMAEAIKVGGYNVTFAFICPESPQYNGVVERMFATLFGMVRSILNKAHTLMILC
jgi:hypothetical protein